MHAGGAADNRRAPANGLPQVDMCHGVGELVDRTELGGKILGLDDARGAQPRHSRRPGIDEELCSRGDIGEAPVERIARRRGIERRIDRLDDPLWPGNGGRSRDIDVDVGRRIVAEEAQAALKFRGARDLAIPIAVLDAGSNAMASPSALDLRAVIDFSSMTSRPKTMSFSPAASFSGRATMGPPVEPRAKPLKRIGGAKAAASLISAFATICSIVSKICGFSSWPGTLITLRPLRMRVSAPASRVKLSKVCAARPGLSR